MSTCQKEGCKNLILMDGYCVRHLKQTCSICMEPVPSTNSCKHKRLSCGHAFHLTCVIKWFPYSDNCPSCRKPQPNDPLVLYKQEIERNMRKTYKNAIESLEHEVTRLRRIL